jgi:hypothetical protein
LTEANETRFGDLLGVLDVVPVPSSRPVFDRSQESASLTMLELALRMEHVSRITETLRFIDRGHVQRAVSIDVDIRTVSATQRRALAVRSSSQLKVNGETRLDGFWIPLARQSRNDLAPVTVHDSANAVVPRLTNEALLTSLSAGMARLLSRQIEARAAGERGERASSNGLLDMRSRWLIERAMANLIQGGSTKAWDAMGTSASKESEAGCQTASDAAARGSAEMIRNVRAKARGYLLDMPEEYAQEFARLLAVATEEQLTVVMIPADSSQAHYTYEAPAIPARARRASLRRRLLDLLPLNREFKLEYHTEIPRTVNSYHVTFQVPEDIHVRRFVLSTNADAIAMRGVVSDLMRLASEADDFGSGASVVHRMELQDVFWRVAAIARRRLEERARYRVYLQRFWAQFGDALNVPSDPPRSWVEVEMALIDGRIDMEVLTSFAMHEEQAHMLGLARREPLQLQKALTHLAVYLETAELARDVSVDNDPRENGAHAHWSYTPVGFGARVMEPVQASVQMTMADEPPALVESVFRMLLGLLGIVLAVGWITSGTPQALIGRTAVPKSALEHLGQADALVAVLLLVPSILLTRLDIPNTHSVLGVLRIFPRRIAYYSVTVTSALAVVVAATWDHRVAAIRAAALLLTGFMLLCGMELLARHYRRRVAVPRSNVIPRWLAERSDHRAPPRPVLPEARFDANAVAYVPVTPNQWQKVWNRFAHALALPWWAVRDLAVRRRVPAMIPEADDSEIFARPADVVSRAARENTQGNTGVRYLIRHRSDASSLFEPPSRDPGSTVTGEDQVQELLGFAACGTLFEVTTGPTTDPDVSDSPLHLVRAKVSRQDGVSIGTGLVALNTHRFGSGMRHSEMLFVLGEAGQSATGNPAAVTWVVRLILEAIQGSGAFPVFMTYPSAPAAEMMGPRELPRDSIGPCLRVAVSADGRHTEARMGFQRAAEALARDFGLGLHLAEGRSGFGLNYWKPIAAFDRATFDRNAPSYSGDQSLQEAVSCTLVLPSGPPATRDLRDLAGFFDDRGIGCLAVSAFSLQQTIFVNLLLPRRTDPAQGPAGVRPSALTGGDAVSGTVLAQLVGQPGPAVTAWPSRVSVVLADVQPVLSDPGDERTRQVPFWVVWRVPAAIGSVRLLRHLRTKFEDLEYSARILYSRAKTTPRGEVRGRAKISVSVPSAWAGDTAPRELGRLAKRVQTEVRSELATTTNVESHETDVYVVWGERWIGETNWHIE